MKNLAIITARGGSKRIPRKNIKEFLGKPIIVYSIEAALSAGCFDEVMVSTDDDEIARIAIEAGAKVPFMRSEKTANDYATSADVIEEVLNTYKEQGQEFDNAVVLYPTAPFVTGPKLYNAMKLLEEKAADSVIPMVGFSFPPQRGFVERDGKIQFAHPEYAKTRSQDLEPLYHDAGQFCCFSTKLFLEKRTLITDKTYGIVYPESEVQDIDTMEDWKIAELKYSLMKEHKDEL